jgi:protein phosphatase 2C family protein 2/3
MAPVPLPNSVCHLRAQVTWNELTCGAPAEFRGPGVHHNYDDSDTGYDVDAEDKSKTFGVGGYKGRIIFLGDGTEVLTDSDDAEMFDNSEEDKDLASQVTKKTSADEDGPPPRAPSPPPRGTKKPATDESTKKDNVATVVNEGVKEGAEGETKPASEN